MEQEPRIKLHQLLNNYLSKKRIRMKPIMINMIRRLETNQSITLRQFQSIIPWVEKDIRMNRYDLLNYFSPVIHELQSPQQTRNTLEKFMNGDPV